MSTLGFFPDTTAAQASCDTDVTPQSENSDVLFVHSCSRLGLQANPPSFRLSFGWFRRR